MLVPFFGGSLERESSLLGVSKGYPYFWELPIFPKRTQKNPKNPPILGNTHIPKKNPKEPKRTQKNPKEPKRTQKKPKEAKRSQ